MAALGQELKKQREARNISLDEMASSTKIVGRYLQALEEDRFDAMPGGFFVKGIIRTYAVYVGLDPDEVLATYRKAGLFEEPARARTVLREAEPAAPRRRWLRPALAVAAGLFLLVVLALAWRSCRPRHAVPAPPAATVLPQARPAAKPAEENKPSAEPAGGQAQAAGKEAAGEQAAKGTAAAPPTTAPSTAASATGGPATPVPRPAEPSPAKPEETTGLTLDLSFQEETWIQVSADGQPKIVGLFPAGGRARARGEKEIVINVLGNAGGVTFLLNGQPGKTLGRTGEVLNNIRITPDNLKDFLRERQPRPTDA
ncbi:MAG TPA: RodZ domain-containing protein [Terriglobales bacterium]|nr:RodZ domain-containing protein [Terriglobales bacterium]